MTDVADSIRKAVDGLNPPRPANPAVNPDEAFRRLRAHVRGVLIDAHRALSQRDGAWTEADDRLLDVTAHWLEQVRDRQ
jgi:hypothetical protein